MSGCLVRNSSWLVGEGFTEGVTLGWVLRGQRVGEEVLWRTPHNLGLLLFCLAGPAGRGGPWSYQLLFN